MIASIGSEDVVIVWYLVRHLFRWPIDLFSLIHKRLDIVRRERGR